MDLHLITNIISIYEGYWMDGERNGFGRYTDSLQINVYLNTALSLNNICIADITSVTKYFII